MRFHRLFAIVPALVLAFHVPSERSVYAAELNADGYDISGFAYQWPEKFSKDDSVVQTDLSYKSHDVNIEITKYAFNRMTGDINEDEKLSIADAVMLSRVIAEDLTVHLSSIGSENSDCDENGEMNIDDLTRMLQYIAGKIPDEEFFVDHHQAYTVADIYVRSLESLRGGFAYGEFPATRSGKTQSIKRMAEDNHALLAINCDYVEIRDNGVVYRNGIMYRDTRRADLAAIFKDGTMQILTDSEYRALTEKQKGEIWQTTNFAPGIVKNGEMLSGFRGSVYTEKHPRSAIGYYEPGHYCFIQADGRQPGYSMGVTMQEWAAFAHSLGVKEAYNMDGGSSSEIVFLGKTVNNPSGISTGSTGGRNSSDILYVCETSEIPAEP